MVLIKNFVRDSTKQTIGSVTTGFDDTSKVVRDNSGNTLGRTSDRFSNTRDSSGNLVSSNTPDPGLLFNRKK
jgi:hypothetical protein